MCGSPKSRGTKIGNKSLLLEQWMTVKPWESRLMEEEGSTYYDSPEITSFSRKSNELVQEQQSFIKARRNNGVTTTISNSSLAMISQSILTSLSSTSSSEYSTFDYSPNSSSSTSYSYSSMSQSVPFSSNTVVEETRGERTFHRPSYMNITESTRAKQRACGNVMNLSGDCRSTCSGSDPSVNMWKGVCETPERQAYQKRNYGK